MPAARLCACSGSAWLRPDGVVAIPTTRALLPSAEVVDLRAIDIRELADLGDRQLHESPRFLLNAKRLSVSSSVPRAPLLWGFDIYTFGPDCGEEGVGQEGEGYVPVPASPATDLVVRETHFPFGLLEAHLHPPAVPCHPRQFCERGALGSEDRVGAEFVWILDGAAHQNRPLKSYLHGRV